MCAVREVDEEEEAQDTNTARDLSCLLARWFCFGQPNSTYHSLEDENPSPARQPMLSVQLHQTKRKNTRQCRSDTSNEIEDGESLLDVIFEESALCSRLEGSCLAISLTSSVPAR